MKNITKLIKYTHPFDVVELFKPYHIGLTLEHLVRKLEWKINESFKQGGVYHGYIQEIVQNKKHDVLHIDYAFLVGCLADLSENGEQLLKDFSHLVWSEKENKSICNVKENTFLVHGILEGYLNIARVNVNKRSTFGRTSVNFSINYFAPIIVKTDNNVYAQMSSVIFNRDKFEELIRDEYKDKLTILDNEFTVQVENVFGAKQCSEFWKESGHEFMYVANV